MKVKDRKIFELSNFRGLDKENKPIKVAPFRATDGENFIIDSGVLKTRPSFEFLEKPFENDSIHIIDFYDFRGYTVFVTNNGFYFKKDGAILSPTTEPKLYTKIENSDNVFNEYSPFFQEEKDCLFVFCLDNIYVISVIETSSAKGIVLYSLNDKPTKAEMEMTEDGGFFDSLPTPYIPTLFIGDKSLDDANLLSNKNEYKCFADNSNGSAGVYNSYYMPTQYNPKKNGNFSWDISVYDNKYNTLKGKPYFKVFPVYLGKEKENFHNSLPSLGEIINNKDEKGKYIPIKISKGYVAKETFEYYEEALLSENIIDGKIKEEFIIKEYLGLSKEDFYNLKIEQQENEKKKSVFEYILGYIQSKMVENPDIFNDNKILLFSIPYKCNCLYKNKTNNFEVKYQEEERTQNIYVQLLVNEVLEDKISITKETKSDKVVKKNESVVPPAYPPFSTGATPDNIELLSKNGPFTRKYNEEIFLKEANSYLDNIVIPNLSKNTGLLAIEAQSVESEKITIPSSFTYEYETNPNKWYYSGPVDKEIYLKPLPDGYNKYGYTEKSIGYVYVSKEDGGLDYYGIKEAVTHTLGDFFRKPSNINLGGFFCITFVVQVRYGDIYQGYNETNYYRGSCIIRYIPPISYIENRAFSYVMYANIVANEKQLANKDLFKISYNEDVGSFVLKYKNYFYNYEKEPMIKIRIAFEKNPEYEIIAKSNFGITFGSENRLFLAGNKEYPNIDRYNVSNDLLGNNDKNQSYELSYFPSKNYRVIGGKGAINGYVIGTDTQLYITKKDYPNDQKLFVRTRVMNDNGVVGYNEFKTNIGVSPLNNKCLARFYNDIVLLTNEGLYGLELADNILTNERLIKLRSGFINRDLKKNVSNNKKSFIYEDNKYMHIVVGNIIYMADSRYVDKNPNGEISNYSYEIVKWVLPFSPKVIRKIKDKLCFLDEYGEHIYIMSNLGKDIYMEKDEYNKFKKVEKLIETKWQSALLDFGNRLYEKTMFRINVFATKQEKSNIINIGYKTMRGLNRNNNIETNVIIDASNPMNFLETDFNLFAMNTFKDFGASLPAKENNFLYIQLLVVGKGKIELNSIDIEYKNNRLLKTYS